MKILYPILIALVSLVMVFNFFSGIVGGIWLIMTGGLSLVITGIIVGFLMPYIYSLVVMPSMGLIVLTEKTLNKNIILAAILGFLASLWEKSITWFWVVLVFYYFIGQSGHFNPFALILAAYATAMAPLQSMASHEEYASNGNAGLGTTMGLFYAQLIFLVMVLAWIINFSPVGLLWILTLAFVAIPTYIIIKSSKTINNEETVYGQSENVIDATEIDESSSTTNLLLDEDQGLKNQLKKTISEKSKILLGLTEKIEELKFDLIVIKQEYDIKIGRLYLKLDELNLEILQQAKIADGLKKGLNIKEAKKIAEEDTQEQREKIDNESSRLDQEEKKEKLLSTEDEKELRSVWKELVRKFHPDLALNSTDRENREKKMRSINDAYENRNLEKLKSILNEKVIEEEEIISAEILQERLSDILRTIEKQEQEYADLLKSEWNIWKTNIAKSKKKKRDLFKELETKILEEISQKQIDLRALKNENEKTK